jgi:PadR family transcriptional regulator PadR
MGKDAPEKNDVLQGTLVLLVLRTLEALGPLHGYGIARRIEQISRDLLRLNQGTLYPALLRMEQEGWITSRWGASEKNRKAKFYSISAAGRRQLAKETLDWRRMSSTSIDFWAPYRTPWRRICYELAQGGCRTASESVHPESAGWRIG